MALNDLRDPKSGMDWYTAATILEKQRQLGTDPANIQPIPYFENILPAGYAATTAANGYTLPANATNTQAVYAEGFEFWANDWTDIQDEIENYAGQTLGLSTRCRISSTHNMALYLPGERLPIPTTMGSRLPFGRGLTICNGISTIPTHILWTMPQDSRPAIHTAARLLRMPFARMTTIPTPTSISGTSST